MTWTKEQRAENRAKWAAALRSGEYDQGSNALVIEQKDGTKQYCCLGVACELAAKEGVIGAFGSHKDRFGTEMPGYPVPASDGEGWEGSILPLPVADWLGITQRGKTTQTYQDSYEDDEGNRVVSEKYIPANLIYFNDERNLSFKEIADIIEGGTLLTDPDDLADNE